MIWDMLRGVAVVLYAVLVYQTLATVWYYNKARRNEKAASGGQPLKGVLPSHVVNVGIAFLFFAGEVVWQNVTRIGEPFGWYAVLNPVGLLLANRAVLLITFFERRRYANSRSRPPLPDTPETGD